MKFDFHVRWIQSGQWVTFQSGEGEENLDHTWITALGHILSPPGSTGVGGLEFQGSTFQQLLDGVI